MSDNALLRELHAARAARRGGGPAEPQVPAPAPAARAAAGTTREISIDSDDDAAPAPAAAPEREGVIEIFDSDSDDGGGLAPSPQRQQHGSPRVGHRDAAATSRRVTTDAIDLTRDSDDEGPRKRQRTARSPRPPPPQRPRIQVIRNYGGVQGLVVAPRFLSEAAERRLFESMGTRCPLPDGRPETKYGRCDLSGAPRARYDRFSPDLWRVINGIRDHVFPELLLPDFALFWSYALKRNRGGGVAFNGEAFARHYDSKITYGETVAGLSVGRASLLVMERCPCDKVERQCKCFFRNSGVATERVEVPLPRGSVYVMSGDARDQRERTHAWKHSIVWPSRPEAAPAWNTSGERRSVTLRATKPWSEYCLANRVAEGLGPTPGDVAARLRQQRSLRISADGREKRPNPAALAAALRAGAVPYQLRFAASDFAA